MFDADSVGGCCERTETIGTGFYPIRIERETVSACGSSGKGANPYQFLGNVVHSVQTRNEGPEEVV